MKIKPTEAYFPLTFKSTLTQISSLLGLYTIAKAKKYKITISKYQEKTEYIPREIMRQTFKKWFSNKLSPFQYDGMNLLTFGYLFLYSELNAVDFDLLTHEVVVGSGAIGP